MNLEHQNQAPTLVGGRDGYSRFGQNPPEHDTFSHGRRGEPLCRVGIHCDDHGRSNSGIGPPDAQADPSSERSEHQVPLASDNMMGQYLNVLWERERRRCRAFEYHDAGHILRRPQCRIFVRLRVRCAGESKGPIVRPDPPATDRPVSELRLQMFRSAPSRGGNRYFVAATPARNRQNRGLHSHRQP